MAEGSSVDGYRYDLSSEGNSSGHKSYLFVKLTDSALKALIDHSKSGGRSSISFNCNEGRIDLDGVRKFDFSMSAAQLQQGSFDCIRQLDSRRLSLLGGLQYRLRVQANEDVYEVTRQRVADAEQAVKKNCTRVLKQSDHLVARRVKTRPVSSTGRSSSATRSVTPNPSRSSTPTLPRSSTPTLNRSSTPTLPRSSTPTNFRSTASSNQPAATSAVCPTATAADVCRTSSRVAPSSAGHTRTSAELMKRPLRERIAHMLATRPYKRVEVVQKLYKGGIREADKKNVPALLSSVATFRDNMYHLKRHLWSELSADWPFYSEQERRQFSSRQPSARENTSPSHQPPLHRTESNARRKRSPPRLLGRGEPPCSKRRQGASPLPSESWLPWSGSIRPEEAEKGVAVATANQTVGQSPSSAGVSDCTPTPESSPETRQETREETADFVVEYPAIQCSSQMMSYRTAFDRCYHEYQRLWSSMDDVRNKFNSLERRLRSCTPGSEQWKDIECRIRAEYASCNTAEYRACRARWEYLQNKLVHIKSMVRQWQAER